MIHTYIPYCPKEKEQDLGFAYNNFMEMLSDDDWACFLDHDAMFTTNNWYHQLTDIIDTHPSVGVFSCVTNRIGNIPQRIQGIDRDNHDIRYHRMIGKELQSKYYSDLRLDHDYHRISGIVILIKKSVWHKIGKFKSGFLSVDNDIHNKCIQYNIPVGIMNGVYVYHWYRGDGDESHLR